MALWDGLNFYEWILLVLGLALFSVLLFLLVDRARKDRPFGGLLPFFLMPVLMIAFPAVHEVEFSDLVVQMNAALPAARGGDPKATAKLRSTVASLEGDFTVSDPRTRSVLLDAHAVLGKAPATRDLAAAKKPVK